MFTGIIEKLATVVASGNTVSLSDPFCDGDVKPGDSLAVNGVCLTLTRSKNGILFFDVSQKTISKTNLGKLKKGDYVNVERALKASSRFGGHFVSGHVDSMGVFEGALKAGNSTVFSFSVSDVKLLVENGSVAVNGVSLTCYDIGSRSFKTSVVPHTYENTNLKFLKKGQPVNIEFDMLAKYAFKKTSRITRDFLSENGWF